MDIDRKDKIRTYIEQQGSVRISDLEVLYPNISGMTIRRDLFALESEGCIRRVRGGAKAIPRGSGLKEDVYSQRISRNTEAKKKIAQNAMQFIETGRSIYIDSGTTTAILAKMIPDADYSIITSGPNIGMDLTLGHSNSRVTLIGGQLNRSNLTVSGPGSLHFLKDLNIDIAFVATTGFSLKSGFTNGDYNECELKKVVIRKAGRVIMLMDSTKIGRNLPFTFATLREVDILITDSELPPEYRDAAKKYNVRVIY
ncbi:MAG TPA: DeoR/GlpR transcriptional regulator [Clostridiales bacterium]|nr:DeoR/GlpR transcriptional regulator [Clostridiales bacterium]